MYRWSKTSSSGAGRFRAVFLLALVAALLLGTVADAFRPHLAESHDGGSALMILDSADNGPSPAIADNDCGIHPGCAAALIPEPPALAGPVAIGGSEPIVDIRRSSVADPGSDHPPIIS